MKSSVAHQTGSSSVLLISTCEVILSDPDRLALLERRAQENAESISELRSSFATRKIIAWLLGLAGFTIVGFMGFTRHQITGMQNDTEVLREQITGLHAEIANIDELAVKKVTEAANNLGYVLASKPGLSVEVGQVLKDDPGLLSVTFQSRFKAPPVVLVAGFSVNSGLNSRSESVEAVDQEGFRIRSGNHTEQGHQYYVFWMAIGEKM